MNTTINRRSNDWMARLHDSGCRQTGSRYAVIEILASSNRALTPQEIFDLSRQQYPTLALVSVYRTLDKLEELKLIQRVHQADRCQAFIAAFEGHQHLLVCQNCGLVEFFHGDDLGAMVRQVEEVSGYCVKDHWLQLFGLCPVCKRGHIG